jgi:hypothetical protein
MAVASALFVAGIAATALAPAMSAAMHAWDSNSILGHAPDPAMLPAQPAIHAQVPSRPSLLIRPSGPIQAVRVKATGVGP